MKIIEGKFQGKDIKVAIIVSRTHELITDELLAGATNEIEKLGVLLDNVSIYKVPGCFELSRIAKKICKQNQNDVVVCLGALIRNASPVFDLLGAELTRSLLNLSVTEETIISFGIVIADSLEDAIESSGVKEKNYGRKAVVSAIELASLEKLIR